LQGLGIAKDKKIEQKAEVTSTALSQQSASRVEAIFHENSDAMTKMKAFTKDVCVPELQATVDKDSLPLVCLYDGLSLL